MFQNLPVELLQYIFMMLSPCADFPNVLRVCRRWRTICKQVMGMRDELCRSAYKLEAPLKWTMPKTSLEGSFTQPLPSKRFGSTVVHHQSVIYVFGGATSMFTTFNDLWAYDLCVQKWKRLLGEGELPTPRAHAKGGFIGDILYLFGGCRSLHHPGWHHLSRINWLTDMNSFDIKKLCWSRVSLHHVHHEMFQCPLLNAGQSGCFLPAGPDGSPSLLVLFGGISLSLGTCVNDLCFIAPHLGLWLSVTHDTNTTSTPWPAGRCGHSACALDPHRMLVMFGNLESLMSPTEPPSRGERLENVDDDVRPYRGQPAGDLWILTRCELKPNQDWSTTSWFWTAIQYPVSVSAIPPIDFYHSVAIGLPFSDTDKSFDNLSESTPDDSYQTRVLTFIVLCISQPTEMVLEEAAKQRRSWQRHKSCTSLKSRSYSRSPSDYRGADNVELTAISSGKAVEPPLTPVELSPTSSSCSSHRLSPSAISTDRLDCVVSTSPKSVSPENTPGLSVSNRNSVDRRAKRLQALAAQERRLFGSRSNTIAECPAGSAQDANTTDSQSNPNILSVTTNPLGVYSLFVSVPLHDHFATIEAPIVTGQWLLPQKSHYADLLFGPHDCLGFSCTFAHGCLFLFGGLSESDELTDTGSQPQTSNDSQGAQQQPRQQYANNMRSSHSGDTHGVIRSSSSPSSPSTKRNVQSSQFYVLQPRSLFGTVF